MERRSREEEWKKQWQDEKRAEVEKRRNEEIEDKLRRQREKERRSTVRTRWTDDK